MNKPAQVQAYEDAREKVWQAHLKRLEPEGGLHPDFGEPFRMIFDAGFYAGFDYGCSVVQSGIQPVLDRMEARTETPPTNANVLERIRRWFV